MDIIKKLEKLLHMAGYSFSYFSVSGVTDHVLVCKESTWPVTFSDIQEEGSIVIRVTPNTEYDSTRSNYENCLQEAVNKIMNMFADDEQFNQANHDAWFELYESPVTNT